MSLLIGTQILTYEVVWVQIKPIINSRHLYPISPDPNDLSPLSPSSLETLEPLTCLLDQDLTHVKIIQLTGKAIITRSLPVLVDAWA